MSKAQKSRKPRDSNPYGALNDTFDTNASESRPASSIKKLSRKPRDSNPYGALMDDSFDTFGGNSRRSSLRSRLSTNSVQSQESMLLNEEEAESEFFGESR